MLAYKNIFKNDHFLVNALLKNRYSLTQYTTYKVMHLGKVLRNGTVTVPLAKKPLNCSQSPSMDSLLQCFDSGGTEF